MRINSFLIVLLFPTLVFSQGYVSISGKIIDKATQQALPNAYLSIPSKGFSSQTNAVGEFKFFFPKIDLDSMLIISAIGYKSISKKASAYDSTSVIELEKAETLASVQGGDPKVLLKEAFALVKKNNPSYPTYQIGFYLETLEMEKLGFVKITEGILRVERPHTAKEIGVEKAKLLKGRKYDWAGQTAKLDGWGFMNGAAIVTRSLEGGIPEYLDKGSINDYDFKIDSLMTYFNDSLVYSMSFWPVNKRVKAARNGKIYIDVNNQAIVRIEYEMTPEGVKDVIGRSFIDNTRKAGKVVKGYTQFLPLNGKWQLQDSKLTFVADFEDKLEKKFTTEATMNVQFMANESMRMGRSAIRLDDELLTTNNFPKGGKYEEEFWSQKNHLVPTPAMLEMMDKMVKK
ncbi:carboxypeptidase-like regulatory domain-containing protein [Emticicia sp. BO119]|uniref:carboxypeptidase-like regulatory domain-containing protein n=1 Tax=Emticicia sp. BO119 TaxID=2757768 RepID=UPI0015F10E40|nr:carboxypeptidase-like regulatory domain-containing protein [Emticicia sp. BO119]MBA4852775.1 carboxypeptidase-like regulatory domain-containing protein [Emticicia sp. BO119]